MKKFFMISLAAFVVMSCAKDPNGGKDVNGTQAGKTHAYFSFKLDGGAKSTRALGEYNPEEGTADAAEANDALFEPGDLHMLIFNADTKVLEQKVVVASSAVSMVLTAGLKKIFVFSNTAMLGDNVTPLGAATFTDRFDALTVNSSTLDNIYVKAFSYSAGVPQVNGMTDMEKADPRTFLLKNLSTRVADGAKGIPMGSTAEVTYNVVADVTAAQAAVVGSANNFDIKIFYMLAKARMQMATGVIGTQADTKTVISDPFFAVKNLATNTNYVQKWGTAGVESYYHNDFDRFTSVAEYLIHFDRAATANVAVSTTPAASKYVYVPENTSKLIFRGQSSYYAVKLTYRPGSVATTVGHDPNDVVKFADKKVLGTGASETGSDDYVYIHTNIVLTEATISAGTFITDLATFKKALWIAENDLAWPGASADADATTLLTAALGKYDGFKNATSWYRLDMGEGVGAATKYGVLRGNKYTATINKITGPGKPGETDLDNGSTTPVVSNTYIHASITAAAWKAVVQGGDL